MKKRIISLLATTVVLSSMTTPVLAESASVAKESTITMSSIEGNHPFGKTLSEQAVEKKKIKTVFESLQEQKVTLQNTIYSTGFSILPTSEKLFLLKELFHTQKQIQNEYQSKFISTTLKTDSEGLLTTLINDQEELNKQLQLLEQAIIDAKKNNEDLTSFKSLLIETFSLVQENRKQGRTLRELAITEQRNNNANMVNSLMTTVELALEEEETAKAIEKLSEVIKLSYGKNEYNELLSELADSEDSYIVWNHQLYSLESGFLQENEKSYVAINELEKLMDVEVTTIEVEEEENEEKELVDKEQQKMEQEPVITIEHEGHVLTYSNELVTLDNISIGKPNVWKQDKENNLYIDTEFIFELFGYYVEKSDDNIFVITKRIYPIEELDKVSVEEIIRHMIK